MIKLMNIPFHTLSYTSYFELYNDCSNTLLSTRYQFKLVEMFGNVNNLLQNVFISYGKIAVEDRVIRQRYFLTILLPAEADRTRND